MGRPLALCGLALTMGLGAAGARAADGPLDVYTVNYPLSYFAERIGGEHVTMRFPAPAEGDPAFWEPDAGTIARYQAADLVLLNGAGYAKWIARVSLRRSRSVDTSQAFADELITIEGAVTHSHGPGGEHAHAGTAFTTWLDPTLAVRQARAIEAAFVAARPDAKADFERGAAELVAELEALDADLREVTSAIGDEPLVFSHPIYQYFQRRYGLNGRSVLWEPDAMPDEEMWSALQAMLEEHPARYFLWEGEPLPEAVERLASMGVESVVYDPAGNRPAEGDFATVMRGNVERLRGIADAVSSRASGDAGR